MPSKLSATSQRERTGGSIVGLGDIHRCVLDFESSKFCVLFSAVQMRKRITFSKIVFEGHLDIHEYFLNVVWTYTRTNPLFFLYASLNKGSSFDNNNKVTFTGDLMAFAKLKFD